MTLTVAIAWGSALTVDPATGRTPVEIESTKTRTTSLEATRDRGATVVMYHVTHAKGQFDAEAIRLFGGGRPEQIIPRWSGLLEPSTRLDKTPWSPGERVVGEDRTVVARGWPWPALWSTTQHVVWQGNALLFQGPVEGGISTSLPAGMFPWRRSLPLRPVPLGFLGDIALFAGMSWILLFSFDALRRRAQSRAARCEACGYPLGRSTVCTECGAKLRAR